MPSNCGARKDSSKYPENLGINQIKEDKEEEYFGQWEEVEIGNAIPWDGKQKRWSLAGQAEQGDR